MYLNVLTCVSFVFVCIMLTFALQYVCIWFDTNKTLCISSVDSVNGSHGCRSSEAAGGLIFFFMNGALFKRKMSNVQTIDNDIYVVIEFSKLLSYLRLGHKDYDPKLPLESLYTSISNVKCFDYH